MGNQMIILLVVGSLLGLFGGNVISKLNPFKAGKVAVVKQESQKEEYFKDKIKGIEYRMTSKNKAQAPAKKTFGQMIGTIVDNSFKIIVVFLLFCGAVFYFTGYNIIKKLRELKKSRDAHKKLNDQLVVGTQNAKKKMNGEQETLSAELGNALDEDSKKLVRNIKSEKSI